MTITRITRIDRELSARSLGCSFGFGGGADDKNRFPASKRSPTFETTNGRGGSTTLVLVDSNKIN